MNGSASQTAGDGRQLVLLEEFEPAGEARMSPRRRRDLLLLGTFLIIVLSTLLYNFVIATPRYASQFSYVVRSLDSSRERFSFLNFAGSGAGADNSKAIVAYIGSRDILRQIDQDGFVSRIFAADGIDVFSAFPSLLAGNDWEDFYRHFQGYVSADFDSQANITTVEVQAFTPEDAYALAQRIMEASERKVNSLNSRASAAMVQSAQAEVDAANTELGQTLARLEAVRDRVQVLEPQLASESAIAISSASAAELAEINVQLGQVLRSAPQSPLIPQLRTRRAALENELLRQTRATAGDPGSLASRLRPYELLNAERDVAEKRLLAASLFLANARSNASRNRLYIEKISEPNRPSTPRYPRGLLNLTLVVLIAGAVLWIARSLSELVIDDDG